MSDPSTCLICERIAMIQAGTNPWFVAELATGYVVLGDHQFFRGYTLLLGKAHLPELHDLPRPERLQFLAEMSDVAEAVFRWVRPRKLNYELLGNAEPHLHWHFFPRHADDPNAGGPSWLVDRALRYGEASRPTPGALQALKGGLLAELRRQPELHIITRMEARHRAAKRSCFRITPGARWNHRSSPTTGRIG